MAFPFHSYSLFSKTKNSPTLMTGDGVEPLTHFGAFEQSTVEPEPPLPPEPAVPAELPPLPASPSEPPLPPALPPALPPLEPPSGNPALPPKAPLCPAVPPVLGPAPLPVLGPAPLPVLAPLPVAPLPEPDSPLSVPPVPLLLPEPPDEDWGAPTSCISLAQATNDTTTARNFKARKDMEPDWARLAETSFRRNKDARGFRCHLSAQSRPKWERLLERGRLEIHQDS